MKKIIQSVAAIVLTISAEAVQYSVTVLDSGAPTGGIVDNTGSAISNGAGYVAFGSFASDSVVTSATSIANLATSFTEIANSVFTNGFGVNGFLDTTISGPNTSTANAYTVIGNGATLAASTQVFVYSHGFALTADPGIPANSLVIRNDAGVLLGGFNNFTLDIGAGNNAAFNLQSLTAIPEPTSITLLGLGAFAFVLRRRR